MEKMRLSIIVPIYNVERYLRKCVDSLLCQDVSEEEYEIILVDDGSPDACGVIADEYAEKYSHIKVFHQENMGLGGARNVGVDASRGKYVQFVDSDDYLEPNVLNGLLRQMENEHLDVLRFNYQHVNEMGNVYAPYKRMKAFVNYNTEVCDGETFLNEHLGYGCYACQFVIRRGLLENVKFREGVYFEDTEWTPRMLLRANRVVSTDKMVYNYLMRKGGITQSVELKKRWKGIEDKMSLIDSLRETQAKAKNKRWFKGMVSLIVMSIVDDVCVNFEQKKDSILKQLKKKNIFPLSCYHLTGKQCIKVSMINVSFKVYCWLLKFGIER